MRLALIALLAATPSIAHAYGEPDAAGRPRAEERFMLALTNQIRQDPHAWAGWDTTLASGSTLRPVVGLPALFESARFHADDMATNNFFEHESHDGTSFSARVTRFFSGPAGENLYFATWNDPYDAMTGWMNSTGHRTNILTPDWTWLGVGYATAGGRHYYVQNFGRTSRAAIPAIPAAGARVDATDQLELVANYYDADQKAPQALEAAVGGVCTTLAQRAGKAGHSTHSAVVANPTDCVSLVFTAVADDGLTTRYPTEGAFLVGERCTRDYDPSIADRGCAVAAESDGPLIIDAEAGGCRCASTPDEALALALFIVLLAPLARRRSR